MTTLTTTEVFDELLLDLRRREKDLDGMRAQHLRQAMKPESENHEAHERGEAERLRRKLEGLRLAISVVEDYRKREL